MMKIIVDDIDYEIIENYRDCYDKELLLENIIKLKIANESLLLK